MHWTTRVTLVAFWLALFAQLWRSEAVVQMFSLGLLAIVTLVFAIEIVLRRRTQRCTSRSSR